MDLHVYVIMFLVSGSNRFNQIENDKSCVHAVCILIFLFCSSCRYWIHLQIHPLKYWKYQVKILLWTISSSGSHQCDPHCLFSSVSKCTSSGAETKESCTWWVRNLNCDVNMNSQRVWAWAMSHAGLLRKCTHFAPVPLLLSPLFYVPYNALWTSCAALLEELISLAQLDPIQELSEEEEGKIEHETVAELADCMLFAWIILSISLLSSRFLNFVVTETIVSFVHVFI